MRAKGPYQTRDKQPVRLMTPTVSAQSVDAQSTAIAAHYSGKI